MTEQPKGEPSAEDSEPRWMSTLRRSWPVAILVAVVAVFAGIKDISEGYEKLLVMLHLKPDALDLAQDTARGQFSDNLARTAWKRLFWSRRYVSTIEFKMSDADIAEIWEGYMAAVEEWERQRYGKHRGVAPLLQQRKANRLRRWHSSISQQYTFVYFENALSRRVRR
jgi:hypothetical protein